MTAEVATMAAEASVALPNDSVDNGAPKKSKESERRRRRRKQKKAAKLSSSSAAADASDADDAEQDADPPQAGEQVEIEYVPEKAEVEDGFLDDFKRVFEKFNFNDGVVGAEGNDKQDDGAVDGAAKKSLDSDSEEEDQDAEQKDKGFSNKKKKLQRRMKIAELKQICSRPDVVEVWDATAADPKLLVFLKSYRNTVPVPRHWCQKRKFLQDKL